MQRIKYLWLRLICLARTVTDGESWWCASQGRDGGGGSVGGGGRGCGHPVQQELALSGHIILIILSIGDLSISLIRTVAGSRLGDSDISSSRCDDQSSLLPLTTGSGCCGWTVAESRGGQGHCSGGDKEQLGVPHAWSSFLDISNISQVSSCEDYKAG